MKEATLTNLSPFQRTTYCAVAFPTPVVADLGAHAVFRTATGDLWPAVRGSVRERRTIYRIRCTNMQPFALVNGVLNANNAEPAPFVFHPWVTDDLGALLPKLGALRANQVREAQPLGTPVLVEQSSAHQLWKYEVWIKQFGLKLTWWAEILSGEPVLRCWGKVTWSDRADPNYNTTFDAIVLATREPFVLDFAQRHGVRAASFVGGEWLLNLTPTGISMQDGCALPLSGVMLCQPQGPSTADAEEGLASQQAAIGGPVLGVSHDWDGHWLAHGNVPRLVTSAAHAVQRQQAWQQFESLLQQPAGWFAPRPIACGPTPWQTGDQEDFGATKGTHVVTDQDPRFLRRMQYAVYAEAFRGTSLLEADGSPLLASNHMRWVTWNGVTHWHTGVSTDRLGKTFVGTPASGWYGYDDEHRSQNNLAAYALLADDPLADDLIACQLQLDLASYRTRHPNMGQGAARAQGRTLQTFAQLYAATGDARWAKLIRDRVPHMLAQPTLQQGWMYALHVGSPDARKQVYNPVTNQLSPWVSMWEHGLAAVGLYAAHKIDPKNGDLYECLRRVCLTLVRFGWMQLDGVRHTVHDIAWRNGEGPLYGMQLARRELTAAPGAGDVGSWTFAGILVARELIGSSPELDGYVRSATGGANATSPRQGEWWAAVRSVT